MLASWSDGASRAAIVDFVARVTRAGEEPGRDRDDLNLPPFTSARSWDGSSFTSPTQSAQIGVTRRPDPKSTARITRSIGGNSAEMNSRDAPPRRSTREGARVLLQLAQEAGHDARTP
jgi:hypothetical protein